MDVKVLSTALDHVKTNRDCHTQDKPGNKLSLNTNTAWKLPQQASIIIIPNETNGKPITSEPEPTDHESTPSPPPVDGRVWGISFKGRIKYMTITYLQKA